MYIVWVLALTVSSGIYGIDLKTIYVSSFKQKQDCEDVGRSMKEDTLEYMTVEYACIPHVTRKV